MNKIYQFSYRNSSVAIFQLSNSKPSHNLNINLVLEMTLYKKYKNYFRKKNQEGFIHYNIRKICLPV